MSKIEEVARAILDCGEGDLSPMVYVDPYKAARAAIEAMREPTDAMVDAMNEHAGSIAPEYAWADAIDAALNEQVAG